MKRRQFVETLGLGVMASSLVACGQSETPAEGTNIKTQLDQLPKVEWKMVTSWPRRFPGLGMAPENLSKIVAAMTGGKFKIKVFGSGELVSAMEVFDAVSQGTAASGHSAAYYWKGKMPSAPFFTSVPFGLTATEMNGWLYYGGGLALWRELYQPFGLIPFGGGNTGVQMGGWFNKKIRSVADIKGLKMRIPGLAGEVFKRLGGTPVALPGSEIYTSMETGAIDATEWVGPYNDVAFGLDKVAKYYYYPGWHEPGPTLEFIFNQQEHDALPPMYKAILEQACRAVNQDMMDEYTFRNIAALQQLKANNEIQILEFPADMISVLRELSSQVLKEVGETSELAGKIYKSYMAYLEGVKAYTSISDGAYLHLR